MTSLFTFLVGGGPLDRVCTAQGLLILIWSLICISLVSATATSHSANRTSCPLCVDMTGPQTRTLGAWDARSQAMLYAHLEKAYGDAGDYCIGEVPGDGVVRDTIGGSFEFTCQLVVAAHSKSGATSSSSNSNSNSNVYSSCSAITPLFVPARYRGLIHKDDGSSNKGDGASLHILMGLPEYRKHAPLHDKSALDFTQELRLAGESSDPLGIKSKNQRGDGKSAANKHTRGKSSRSYVSSAAWYAQQFLPLRLVEGALGRTRTQLRAYTQAVARYPWYHPLGIERLFLRRTVQVKYTLWEDRVVRQTAYNSHGDGADGYDDDDDDEVFYASASVPKAPRTSLLSDGSLNWVRIVSYAPSRDSNVHGHLKCDFRTVLEARALWREAEHSLRQQQKQQRTASGGDELRAAASAYYRDEEEEGDVGGHRGTASAATAASGGGSFFILQRLLGSAFSFVFPSSGKGSSSTMDDDIYRHMAQSQSRVLLAADAVLRSVHEELGPLQPASSPIIPAWVRQLVGARTLQSQQKLLTVIHSSDDGADKRRLEEVFVYETSLPATQAVCLSLLLVEGKERVPLSVTETLSFDWLWLKLFFVFVALKFAKPLAEESRVVRLIMAGGFGIVVLIIAAAIYALKELQKMTVGKVGVVVLLAVGGMAALTEAMLSVAAYSLQQLQDQEGTVLPYVLLVVFILGAVSSLVMSALFPASYLRTGTRVGLYGWLVLFLTLSYLRNAEATVLGVAAVVVARPSYIVSLLVWASRGRQLEAETTSSDLDAEDGGIPAAAREAVDYAAPLAVEGMRYAVGVNADGSKKSAEEVHRQKMQRYEEDGALHTRKALEALAAHMRAHPGHYAHRLRDPNAMQRWAGSDCDFSEEEEEQS